MKIVVSLVILFAAACGTRKDTASSNSTGGTGSMGSAVQAEQPSANAAKRRDAAVDSPVIHDAFLGPTPGLVTCYASGSPDAECNLSTTYCCWSNYSSPAFGSCIANGTQCSHSDEHCDGPEDCASGQTCYAHNWSDGDVFHWTVACAASPTAPGDRIMCRIGGAACPSGTSCVQAGAAGINEMLLTQYVCN